MGFFFFFFRFGFVGVLWVVVIVIILVRGVYMFFLKCFLLGFFVRVGFFGDWDGENGRVGWDGMRWDGMLYIYYLCWEKWLWWIFSARGDFQGILNLQGGGEAGGGEMIDCMYVCTVFFFESLVV